MRRPLIAVPAIAVFAAAPSSPLVSSPIGTVANAVLVRAVIDLVLSLVHPLHALWAPAALLACGVAGNGVATGLYIGAGLGPDEMPGASRAR